MAQDFNKLRNDAAAAISDLTQRTTLAKQYELFRPKRINVSDLTLPVLQAGERQVIQCAVGHLAYPDAALAAFFTNAASAADVQALTVLPSTDATAVLSGNMTVAASGLVTLAMPYLTTTLMLYITTDYTRSARFGMTPSGAEKDASGNAFPASRFAYGTINRGTLVGYYSASLSGTPGLFKSNKNIILESAWLGGDGYAYFAVKNIDSTANTAVTVRAAFYE